MQASAPSTILPDIAWARAPFAGKGGPRPGGRDLHSGPRREPLRPSPLRRERSVGEQNTISPQPQDARPHPVRVTRPAIFTGWLPRDSTDGVLSLTSRPDAGHPHSGPVGRPPGSTIPTLRRRERRSAGHNRSRHHSLPNPSRSTRGLREVKAAESRGCSCPRSRYHYTID